MQTTLSDLLKPYRAASLAEATGRSRSTASEWRRGAVLPDADVMPALASFLRIDLGELVTICAEDTKRRNSALVSVPESAA